MNFKKITRYFVVVTISILTLSTTTNLFEISKNLEILSSVYRELDVNFVDEIEPGELMKTGVDAMMESLDPYTVYYPESQIEDVRFMRTGEYGGIGANIELWEDKFFINLMDTTSPAYKAGVKIGDEVFSVNGKSLKGLDYQQFSDVLSGPVGKELTLNLLRKGQKVSITLMREKIKMPDVPYHGMIDSTIGYVKLSSFTQTASASVEDAFLKLKDSGMNKLIFDLRGNGGGLLTEAVNIVNLWVPKRINLVEMKGRLSSANKIFQTLKAPKDLNIPIVVLVDSNSASASEIVSASLQDLDRGVVMGNQSYGKGLVQQTRDVAYGGMIKVTIAKYYTPSGRCVQRIHYKQNTGTSSYDDSQKYYTNNKRLVYGGHGVDPDVEVPYPFRSDFFNQIINTHQIFFWANQTDITKMTNSEAFEDFSSYIERINFNYESDVLKSYEDLVLKAKQENYISSEQDLNALKMELTQSVSQLLEKNKEVLLKEIEREQVLRKNFESGLKIYDLKGDSLMQKAKQLLYNKNEYSKILSPEL